MDFNALGNARVSGKGNDTSRAEKGIARGVLKTGTYTEGELIHNCCVIYLLISAILL
jgi:hypothetical protein